jgi:hypothetical protein
VACRFQFGKVVRPVGIAVPAHVVQRLPGVDAGVVAVVKIRLDGVIADRVDLGDGDIPSSKAISKTRDFWCRLISIGFGVSVISQCPFSRVVQSIHRKEAGTQGVE